MQRYRYLDSLRGIAICGVVMIHVGQAIAGLPKPISAFAEFGLRGVQLFFIVSALTLCLVTKPETLDLRRFYTRRFFRVAPMFYVAGAFYLLARYFGLMDFAPYGVNVVDVASTLLFVHGFNPHAINNVVPGGWSIASEATFYALFPLLISHINSLKRAGLLLIFAVILAVANTSLFLIFRDFFTDHFWQTFLHFNFLSNFPAFACGIFLFHLIARLGDAPLQTKANVVTTALLLIIVVFSCFGGNIPLDQLLFLPILGALVFVAARYEPKALVNRTLSFLGEISFSLYLVHFAILKFVEMAPLPVISPVADLAVLYGLTMIGSAGAAWITHRLIERPFMAWGRRLSNRHAAPPTVPAVA